MNQTKSLRTDSAQNRSAVANKDSGHRIGFYIRVSTEEQAENPEGSIKNQEERLKAALSLKKMERPGFGELSGTFTDRARSGKDMDRPELQRLLLAIRRNEIDLVMVSELSRLSRSIKDFSEIWELMKRQGCQFLSLRENFDTTTAAGEMVLYTIANIAQFERKQIGERVYANVQARASRGLYNGGPVPLGYQLNPDRKGYLEVDPSQAQVVMKAFDAFLAERTLTKAALWLNTNGYRYKREMQGGGRVPRLGHFTVQNLHNLLRNRSYLGVKSYKTKAGVKKEVKAVWEPLIDASIFESAQELLSKNHCRFKPDSPDRFPFILSGMLYCATCGERLCGKTANGNGGRIAYYEHGWATKRQACLVKKVFDCNPNRILAKHLEPAVWAEVVTVLTQPNVSKALLDEAWRNRETKTAGAEMDRIRGHLSSIKCQLEALAERLSQLPSGVPATPIYTQMEKLEKIRVGEQTRLDELKKSAPSEHMENPAQAEAFNRYLRILLDLAESEVSPGSQVRRLILEKLVQKIEITPDSFKLYFYVGENRIERGLAQQCAGLPPPFRGAGEQRAHESLRDSGESKILRFFGSNSLQNGVPTGIRTPVCAVRGRRPRPLDDRDV